MFWNSLITILLVGAAAVWWASRIDTGVKKIPAIEGRLDELSSKVDQILGYLKSPSGKDVLISSSPLTLTDYGKKLFDLINGERIVNNHHTKIEIDEHMTDYEIQKACNDFTFLNMFDELSNAERTSIYDVAYNEGIRVEAIKSLLAISFRDKLLSIRALSASNNIE